MCKIYIKGATYDYNTDRGQSQYTVSLQMQEQNVDQRENEAEELRALERYNTTSF